MGPRLPQIGDAQESLRRCAAPVPPSPWTALADSFDVQADGDQRQDAVYGDPGLQGIDHWLLCNCCRGVEWANCARVESTLLWSDVVNRLLFCCLVMLTTVSGVAAESMQLTVNGQARTFQLERPAGQGPSPTIIMLHGGGGRASEEAQLSGLAQLGPREGFVTIFPQATGGLWNFFLTGEETVQYAKFFQNHGGLPDDVAFLKMLAADLVRDGIADPKRIYLAGRSLGGVMVLRLACLDAEWFAAIGLLISAMPQVIGSHCHPPKPVPVLMINGTDDRVTSQTIGDRMRVARQQANLSMEEVGKSVAQKINRPQGAYSPQAVQQWEKNGTSPDLETVAAFAELVGCDLSWLIRGRSVASANSGFKL